MLKRDRSGWLSGSLARRGGGMDKINFGVGFIPLITAREQAGTQVTFASHIPSPYPLPYTHTPPPLSLSLNTSMPHDTAPNITVQGGRNPIVMHNTCEDSLLAAPIILDMVLLAEMATRIEFRVDGEEFHGFHPVCALLSYLSKAPLVPPGACVAPHHASRDHGSHCAVHAVEGAIVERCGDLSILRIEPARNSAAVTN
jgi:hypothetical protein